MKKQRRQAAENDREVGVVKEIVSKVADTSAVEVDTAVEVVEVGVDTVGVVIEVVIETELAGVRVAAKVSVAAGRIAKGTLVPAAVLGPAIVAALEETPTFYVKVPTRKQFF